MSATSVRYQTKRVKQLFRIVTGSTPRGDEPRYWDGDIAWVTPDDLGRLDGQEVRSSGRSITHEGMMSCATSLSPSGSLVLSTRAPIGYVASTAIDFAINQGCRALVPRSRVFPPYYRYVLRTRRQELQALGRGSTFQELSTQDLGDVLVPAPSYDQQQAIVRFLDEETTNIDALIERKQRLLLLINEQRRGLVAEAVTKGLDKQRHLVDSGIAWIGEIPETWTVRRIKLVARLASGHTPSRSHPEYWIDPDIPWFQLTDIWRFRDDSEESVVETAEMISEVGLRNSAAELLPTGTVALSRTASVGFSAILGVDMATTQDFANWVPGPLVDSAYLLYVLRAMRPEFERLRFGSTHKTIYMPDIKQLVMPLPPLDEQKEIVSNVRADSKRLLQTRHRVEDAVEKLKEYRAALITAAVTGQIDIPEAA